jgi:hypothetical protein
LDLTSSLLWYTTLLNPTLSGIKKAVFLGTASLFNLVSLDLGYIVISPISALNKEAFLGNGSALSVIYRRTCPSTDVDRVNCIELCFLNVCI